MNIVKTRKYKNKNKKNITQHKSYTGGDDSLKISAKCFNQIEALKKSNKPSDKQKYDLIIKLINQYNEEQNNDNKKNLIKQLNQLIQNECKIGDSNEDKDLTNEAFKSIFFVFLLSIHSYSIQVQIVIKD